MLATSGADKDGVKTPGSEITVMIAELFTPGTNTWEQVATQNRERTYHNTAVLMRDGRVLVGGHAPITNSYLAHMSLGPPFTPATRAATRRSRSTAPGTCSGTTGP